jgi:hypothetical protein
MGEGIQKTGQAWQFTAQAWAAGPKQFLKWLFIPFVKLLDVVLGTSAAKPIDATDDDGIPESGPPRQTNVSLFVILNILLLVNLVVAPPGRYTFMLVIAALVFLCLCFLAALLVIDEETEYWNGLRSENMFGAENAIKNPRVLVASTIFFLLFLSLFVSQWDVLSDGPFVRTLPRTGCDAEACRYLHYSIAIFYEVPLIGWVLRFVAPQGGAILSDVSGTQLKMGIEFLTATYIFGVFKYAYFQRSAINDLLRAFGRGANLEFLAHRVMRAPESLVDQLIDRALRDPDVEVRRSYIIALLDAKIFKFMPIFLENLNEQYFVNQRRGLERVRALVNTNGDQFDRALIFRSLDALKSQMEEPRSSNYGQPVKDLMNGLILDYAQLIVDLEFRPPMRKLRRMFELAKGPDSDVQRRALGLAMIINPNRVAGRTRQMQVEAIELPEPVDDGAMPLVDILPTEIAGLSPNIG